MVIVVPPSRNRGGRAIGGRLQPGGFTIATWNVNSLRVRLPSVLRYLDERAPDVRCRPEDRAWRTPGRVTAQRPAARTVPPFSSHAASVESVQPWPLQPFLPLHLVAAVLQLLTSSAFDVAVSANVK